MESENQTLAQHLAFIGYPGYGYLRQSCERGETPMKVLLEILSCIDPEPRLIEALPWIILHHWRMDFHRLIERAKTSHVQNQLGFLVSIARRISQTGRNHLRTEALKQIEAELDNVRVNGEFFLFPIKTTVQRDWIASNREPEAKHWGILATLKPEHIDYESWLDDPCVAQD
jgi:hypothetical protein